MTGTFVKADGVTPVGGGQIKLLRKAGPSPSPPAPATRRTLGRFRMDYVPLGDFVLEGFEPTTERSGRGSGKLAQDGETVDVKVTVLPRGTVQGVVLNYGGTAPVDRAEVRIASAAPRTTTIPRRPARTGASPSPGSRPAASSSTAPTPATA